MALVRDVICDMEVDPATAPAQSEYNGKMFYFCAEGCKREFDADPEKYAHLTTAISGNSARHWWEIWRR